MKCETIIKCFRKCGIMLSESLVARIRESVDLFGDVDEECDLRALVGELPDSICSPEEYCLW